ncbi:hypothetical protein [Streptacidiphilus fuscans]|uniref:Uncharacterized protein n=1 Tax=Streptacidiphilus fuscans TaxID=2789292 RepID=A0A931BA18_9ACTN|nr:hypothetical protein [Streptacidiphilus fuscans]MBF9071600.1 hypothetical protein [Streptacidiphilus fuscans]MBF9072913.1 hypothetical protein [Streptacidiphilus fuscans]
MSLSIPPTNCIAAFPPIRAGRGRHRLPGPVRRRPGPVAAGLLVAATTLAVGSLRQPPGPGESAPTAGARAHAQTGAFPQVAAEPPPAAPPHG